MTDEKKEKQPEAGRRGRRQFEPTDEQRQQVSEAAKAGTSHKDIAALVGVSVSTLRKRFADELAAVGGLFAPGRKSRPSAKAGNAGRKEFQATEDQRHRVRVLKAAGFANAEICEAIGVSEPTLTKHFANELVLGRAKTRADLILAMHRKAKAGSVPAQKALLDTIEAADIADAEKAMGDLGGPQPADEPQKSAPIGKKELAQLEANNIDDDGWKGLIQ